MTWDAIGGFVEKRDLILNDDSDTVWRIKLGGLG